MKKQTIKVKLSLNGKKVQIGHQFLEDISRNIDDARENRKIFTLLATSDNPAIRKSISNHYHLTKKAVNILINDTSSTVINNILSNSSAAKYISHNKLMKFIKSDNITYLCSIASNIEGFKKEDACKIINILVNHKNPLVKYNLVKYGASELINTATIKQLTKDKDIDVSSSAKDEYKTRINQR